MNIRERVEECVKIKENECLSFQGQYKTGGAKYFVIYKDGKIVQNDFIPVLDESNIEFVFIFLKLYPVHGRGSYYTYLSPIIINQNLLASEEKLKIDDWIFEFIGQNINGGAQVIQVKISNDMLGYYKSQSFSVNNFSDLYQFLITFLKCNTKAEAKYLFDLFQKDEKINDLIKSISRLEAELHIKNLGIESYTSLLDSIKELVISKH